MSGLIDKTKSGFLYKFAERAGAQGFNFIVSLVLARLLMPEEYGIIALVTVIITILDVFVTYGFGNSLIANKDSDDIDFSTCFYFGLILAFVVYALVFMLAPLISIFYKYGDELTPVIRVMALRIPIASINSVQQAYVSKHMDFKKFFYATLIGTVISGVIAIIMAYYGFGIWALVEQYLGNVIIDTICLWIIVGWRPKLVFSFKRLKSIYDYGWKILAVGLIDTIYNQIRSLVIGKKYSSSDLALYNKGTQFPAFGMQLVEPTINSVLFPALSQCRDDQAMMRGIARRVIKLTTYIVFPIMVGLGVVAEPLIVTLLTEKWIDSVIYLQIGCIAYMFRPLQFVNNSIIKASGNSGLLLKLDIIKKIIGIASLFVGMYYGVIGIALSLVFVYIVSTILNIAPNRKILNYGYWLQFSDIFVNLAISAAMGVIVYLLRFAISNDLILLVVQIITGVMVYIGLSLLTKNESFLYLKDMIVKMKKRK